MLRTFEERKAEVFRRSQNQIKKRRRRRARLGVGALTAVLCAAVLSTLTAPHLPQTPPEQEGEAGLPAWFFQFTSLVAQVDVIWDGGSVSLTAPQEIQSLTGRLFAYGVLFSYGGPVDGGIEEPLFSDTVFTVTLIMGSGQQHAYTLCGNQLTNRATGQTHLLSLPQVEDLCALLRVPPQPLQKEENE